MENQGRMNKVDDFYDFIRPLAAEGNEFAMRALLQVMASDEPEAEVDRIVAAYAVIARGIVEVGRQIGLAFGRVLATVQQDDSTPPD